MKKMASLLQYMNQKLCTTLPLAMVLILFTFAASGIHAQSDGLPTETKRLLKLLSEFEAREQQKFDEAVTEKRKKVIEALKKQLKATTRDGHLAKALLIQKEIKRLQDLVQVDVPSSLIPFSISFEKNGSAYNPVKRPSEFFIDRNQERGKLILKFKHDQLPSLLVGDYKIELVFKVANAESADSTDSATVKWGNVILGRKKGLKQGEKIIIEIDAWKIRSDSSELVLELSCSGDDGYTVQLEGAENSPVMQLTPK